MNYKNINWKIIGSIIAVLILLVVGYIYIQIGPYNKNSKKDILIEIPKGATLTKVSSILEENKLIKNRVLFKVVSKFKEDNNGVKAGKYLLSQKYSNSEILDILISGKTYNDGIKVTIPEGSTYKEVIKYLTNKKIGKAEVYEELINNPKEFYDKYKFLDEKDITTLEGFLYPDTYYFEKDMSEKDVISAMLKRFSEVYTPELKEKQKKMGLTLQQVINMASIIEKEAVKDVDRPKIAGVFYNRLEIGMPLQSDATIQYIFDERKHIVSYSDLKIDSPYNSYLNKGLPPTPIANPGIKSIEAALEPEDNDYLYFVATVDGGNNYSKTYDEHLKYVKEYKENRDKLKQEKSEK
ncbi:MAG: endolytic transglycosylase MltG [Peptostreptococcaceae bacterium]|nr:endolytic transglycosylase MltG [Peptostreptococcaceae bacterium]